MLSLRSPWAVCLSRFLWRSLITQSMTPEGLALVNIKQIKDVLLYGPPGMGKALFACQVRSLRE